jgi:arsenate reductase-like glutaredoxin family protein
MLFINANSSEVKQANSDHLSYLKCRIGKRLTGKNCSKNQPCSVCSSTKKVRTSKVSATFNDLKDFVDTNDNLEKILGGKPDVLFAINDEMYKAILNPADYANVANYFDTPLKKRSTYTNIHNLISDIEVIFNYDWFIGLGTSELYHSYKLAENLKRRTCSYCNRMYATTIRSKTAGKLMRPQFDHWFPKSKYPLLALSFYNLIPSCATCNSTVKKNVELSIKEHVHPYIDNEIDSVYFKYVFDKRSNKYKIFMLRKSTEGIKMINTVRKLAIDTMYNAHLDELDDLIRTKQAYSSSYIDNMKKLMKGHLKDNEVYRILFGTELESTDFHKRPLSKFKSDILKQLEILPTSL